MGPPNTVAAAHPWQGGSRANLGTFSEGTVVSPYSFPARSATEIAASIIAVRHRTETAIGPAFGALADLGELVLKARDAGLSEDEEVKFADAFNAVYYNLPYVNLFYVKPALDLLFLSSLREAASPGHLRRADTRRKKDYGQHNIMPKPLDPFGSL